MAMRGVLVASSADEWAQVITESFVPLSLGPVVGAFRGSVRPNVLGPAATLTEVRTHGPSVVVRSKRLVRSEPRDDYLFSLHLAGQGGVLQGAQEAPFAVGGGALYDTSQPYELRFPTDARQIVLQIPREELRVRGEHVEDLRGRTMPGGHPAVRVLAAYMCELAELGEQLGMDESAELGVTAVDLLATALRATSGTGSGVVGGRAALLASMRTYVHEHLGDAGLTPDELAHHHGVSLRYVGELFSAAGTSPAAFIRGERVRAAHRLLADPRYSGLTVHAVARRCGFADRTTFTRSFVRVFGRTPADLRSETGRQA